MTKVYARKVVRKAFWTRGNALLSVMEFNAAQKGRNETSSTVYVAVFEDTWWGGGAMVIYEYGRAQDG